MPPSGQHATRLIFEFVKFSRPGRHEEHRTNEQQVLTGQDMRFTVPLIHDITRRRIGTGLGRQLDQRLQRLNVALPHCLV
jgi:hypothetical protein